MKGVNTYLFSGAKLGVLLIAALGILCGAVVLTASRMFDARDQARKAEREFRRVMAQATVLEQEQREFAALRMPPPDFAASLIRSLASAGVPADRLLSVTPGLAQLQRERGEGSSRLVKEQASAVLSPLSLAEVGRVLAAWNQQEHGCVVTRVEISEAQGAHVSQSNEATAAPLWVLLVVEGVRVESDGGALP